MHPQYVATQSSSARFIDAAESQALASKTVSYLFNRFRASFPQGYTQVAYPQNARGNRQSVGNLRVENRDRSLQCKRASRAFLPFPCLPSWRHVVAATMQVTWKNLWLLTQFQSPSSRFSLVSTTKLTSGQAAAPVPTTTRFCSPPIGGFA
jgi:hypothetical protein